jgi:catechol 2,3-dioxygenase-like lactoylglutathione lyase family enzyme
MDSLISTFHPAKVGPVCIHHVAVQTADLDNSTEWYVDFFSGRITHTVEKFMPLITRRLPGISKLVEVTFGAIRFHLFTCGAECDQLPLADATQFQHICMSVDSAESLHAWRSRWQKMYSSGRYTFAFPASHATEIITDPQGAQSFYAFDPNGLEYEFVYDPNQAR